MNLYLLNQITHTDIVNQSDASESEFFSSLSVHESKQDQKSSDAIDD